MMKRFRRWNRFDAQQGALGASPSPESGPQIAGLIQTLDQLEARLQHLRTGVDNLAQLQHLQDQLTAPAEQALLAATEVQALQQQIEDLEATVTSQFFPWQALREVFWQAVRFGGLGLVVGWFLRGVVGG